MFKIKIKKGSDERSPRRQLHVDGSPAMRGQVFSYHASSRSQRPNAERGEKLPEADAVSARAGKHRSALLLKRGPIMLLSVLLLVVFCFNLPLGNQPKIVADKASSGTIFLRNPAVYEAAARELISKSFFNNNKLTINTGRIASELHNRYPELTAVDVGVPLFGRQPVINLEPAIPRMLLSSGSDLFVIDSYGRALLDAKQVVNIDKMGLPVVTDQSGLAVELGKPVVPSASVSFITEVYGQLKANKISVTGLTLPVGTNELDIRVSGAPYFIKCNLRGNGRVEAGAYLAVKKQLEREHKTVGSYIDVRVEDRAYYK